METYRLTHLTKGPHSLGGKNSNNISIRYRGIHPSFLGNIDLLVCGNSDPGTSGVLSPFGKIDGLYFDNSSEPDDFMYDLSRDIKRIMEEEGATYLEFKADNKEDFHKILNTINTMNDGLLSVKGTSKDKYTVIVENPDDVDNDGDESSEESGGDVDEIE